MVRTRSSRFEIPAASRPRCGLVELPAVAPEGPGGPVVATAPTAPSPEPAREPEAAIEPTATMVATATLKAGPEPASSSRLPRVGDTVRYDGAEARVLGVTDSNAPASALTLETYDVRLVRGAAPLHRWTYPGASNSVRRWALIGNDGYPVSPMLARPFEPEPAPSPVDPDESDWARMNRHRAEGRAREARALCCPCRAWGQNACISTRCTTTARRVPRTIGMS